MTDAARSADGPAATGGGSHIRALLGDPNFFSVWTVGGLSGVIRWFQLLAFGVYTFEITGSPLLVSSIPVLWMLPLTLCGPLVGVVSERLNRKTLLTASLASVTALQVVMAALAREGELGYGAIAVASFLSGLFWASDIPLRRRILGDLSGGRVSAAMGLDSATGNATRMAGPLLGGVVLQLLGMFGVFALSGAIYGACLLLALAARVPGRAGIGGAPPFLRDLAGGVRFAAGDPTLRRILSVTIVFNIWGFPFTSMIPILGRDELGLSPFLVGVLSSMEGLGAFVGAMAIAIHARPEAFFRIYIYGTVFYLAAIGYLSVLTFVAGGPWHSFLATGATLAAIGVGSACFAAMQGTLTYLAAPPEYRSRVLGVLTLCIGTGPIGFFNVGWMAEAFGVASALAIVSAEGLFALLVLWAWSGDAPVRAPDGDGGRPGADAPSRR